MNSRHSERSDSKEELKNSSSGEHSKRFNVQESYQDHMQDLQNLRGAEHANLLPETQIVLKNSQQKRIYDRWTALTKQEITWNSEGFHKLAQGLELDHQQMKELSKKSFAKIEDMVKAIATEGATSEYVIKKLRLQYSLVQPFRGAYTVLTGRSHGRQISSWKSDAKGYLEQNLQSTSGQAYKDNKMGQRYKDIDEDLKNPSNAEINRAYIETKNSISQASDNSKKAEIANTFLDKFIESRQKAYQDTLDAKKALRRNWWQKVSHSAVLALWGEIKQR